MSVNRMVTGFLSPSTRVWEFRVVSLLYAVPPFETSGGIPSPPDGYSLR